MHVAGVADDGRHRLLQRVERIVEVSLQPGIGSDEILREPMRQISIGEPVERRAQGLDHLGLFPAGGRTDLLAAPTLVLRPAPIGGRAGFGALCGKHVVAKACDRARDFADFIAPARSREGDRNVAAGEPFGAENQLFERLRQVSGQPERPSGSYDAESDGDENEHEGSRFRSGAHLGDPRARIPSGQDEGLAQHGLQAVGIALQDVQRLDLWRGLQTQHALGLTAPSGEARRGVEVQLRHFRRKRGGQQACHVRVHRSRAVVKTLFDLGGIDEVGHRGHFRDEISKGVEVVMGPPAEFAGLDRLAGDEGDIRVFDVAAIARERGDHYRDDDEPEQGYQDFGLDRHRGALRQFGRFGSGVSTFSAVRLFRKSIRSWSPPC